jgi:hypothetical protein
MKELQKHLDAFELYFQYKQSGHNTTQSIKLVKGKCKVSEKSLYKWKEEFDWDERETIRSLKINKEVQKKTNSTVANNKAQYLGIEISSIHDLNLVIKGSLLVQDEPTEHIKENSKQIHKLTSNDSFIDDPDYIQAKSKAMNEYYAIKKKKNERVRSLN